MEPDSIRHQRGELAAMAQQVEDAEQRILAIALERLGEVQAQLKQARVAALTDADGAKSRYVELATERGRLELVIANARAVLAE